ncbi:ATP-binding protein [Actinoallomurus purpureus]|uniref:ATP-binding protein n=1 Tax=Actinoallomurus purpureus TaxID=478114 RepID=UPI002093F1F4|nr:ATP-binding protein [Actinoallomurus purpureus]MCO6008186.1 ATP-binding protein [Actinoallomurus purpureus]
MGASVWDLARTLTACRLVEVPRRRLTDESESGGRDEWRDQRLAALVSAYHGGGPVLVGWRRASAGGPVEVYVGGESLITEDGTGGAALNLPVGGRGRMLRPGAVADVMGDLPSWARIGGITDGLLTDDQSDASAQVVRPSLEDCLLSVWTQPFAWLLLAEPVNTAETGRLADEIADRAYTAQSMAERSPENAVEAARLERRHRELRQAGTSGLWRVRLLAGGMSPQAATRVAALVCASADLDGLPYALAPAPDGDEFATAERGSAWPFEAGSRLVSALARPPVREVPGVRFVVRPEFDVTPETASGGVPLGRVLDRNRADVGMLSVPLESLNRHTFVCGATGAGKSQTVRGLLASATAAGLPWLVVEPAKAEYRLMAARLPDAEVIAIRPGDVDAIAAGINPLEPAKDANGRAFPLQTHADLVRALFLAAFESDEPFPQVLSAALTRCYEQLGWDLALGEPRTPGTMPRYPTLADLQAAAEDVVTEIGYGKEITDNVRGFIRVRLSSLRLGTTGRFFEGGHPIDFERLLSRNVVFEIEDVGDDRDKAFLMGTVLVRLVEYLRMRQRAGGGVATGLAHLSVFEEAHRLLRRSEESGPAAHAVEMFAGLLAEIRAYGEGLIVAEQIPSKLVPDVIKNTAVKIVHRLPAKDDRDAVGATMNITEAQSQFLVTLRPGEGAVFSDGMDYPHLVRMPDGTAIESTRPAVLASPKALVTSRSGTCGADCRTSPCTLRDMRTAQRVLADHPSIVLWAELTVAAHLTGWGSPVPSPTLVDSLRALPDRLRDCALSHAVDAAVAARASVIAGRSDPGGLADHLITVLRGRLDGGSVCTGEEPRWFTAPYRWCLVLEELQTAHRRSPDADRHRDGDSWERVYGRPVPGDGVAEQLEHVTRWWDRDQRDQAARDATLWGAGTPSAIETAVGARRADDDWAELLTEAVIDLSNIGGLVRFYTPATG